jgi:hypothetical protein
MKRKPPGSVSGGFLIWSSGRRYVVLAYPRTSTIISPFPVARNPDPFPAIGGPSIIPISRRPNPVTAVISVIVVIIGGIVVIPMDDRRRRIENDRWSDKEAKVGMAMAVMFVWAPG